MLTTIRSLIRINNAQVTTATLNTNHSQLRFKSKKTKPSPEITDSETQSEEKDFLDEITDKNIKTIKANVSSLRLDAIIKSGLGISRNKIETIFYESKIRLNGEKVLKKHINVQEGDEIDIIKGVSVHNPNFLTVARVEVVSTEDKGENFGVKLRRNKSLLVENYKEPWKQ